MKRTHMEARTHPAHKLKRTPGTRRRAWSAACLPRRARPSPRAQAPATPAACPSLQSRPLAQRSPPPDPAKPAAHRRSADRALVTYEHARVWLCACSVCIRVCVCVQALLPAASVPAKQRCGVAAKPDTACVCGYVCACVCAAAKPVRVCACVCACVPQQSPCVCARACAPQQSPCVCARACAPQQSPCVCACVRVCVCRSKARACVRVCACVCAAAKPVRVCACVFPITHAECVIARGGTHTNTLSHTC